MFGKKRDHFSHKYFILFPLQNLRDIFCVVRWTSLFLHPQNMTLWRERADSLINYYYCNFEIMLSKLVKIIVTGFVNPYWHNFSYVLVLKYALLYVMSLPWNCLWKMWFCNWQDDKFKISQRYHASDKRQVQSMRYCSQSQWVYN